MKNLITFILYCLSITAMIAQSDSDSRLMVLSSTESETVLQFNLDGVSQSPVQTPNGEALVIGFTEGTQFLLKGAPDLPKYATTLRLPATGNMAVEVLESEYTDYPDVDVAPSKGNLLRKVDPSTVPYTYGSQYERDQFFPAKNAALQSTFIMREARGQGLWIQPVQYNPVNRVLRVYTKLVVRVYQTAEEGENELDERENPIKKSKAFENLYEQIFVNNNAFPVERSTQVDPEKMLIIANDDYVDILQPFMDWKRQKGIHTTLVTVSEIGSSDAADVYNFVADYYAQEGITYILIAGDEDDVYPEMRPSGGGMYSCDVCLGYMEGDDHLPEIFVGRFNAENADQLQIMVDRNLEYEMNPLNDVDANWMATALAACSNEGQGIGDDDQADWEHGNEWKIKHLDDGFEQVYEFYDGNHAADSPTPGDITADQPGNPINTQIVDLINNRGISLYNYTGHGWEQGLASGNFNTDAVSQLRNHNRYPIIIGVACCAGDFTDNGGGDCLGEAAQKAGDAVAGEPWGAIYGFFSSDYQSWAPPMEGQDGMNQYLVDADGVNLRPTLGGMLVFGNSGMIVDYGVGGETMADFWNPFGEPSLVPRTRLAADLAATHVPSLVLNSTSLSVSCDVEGALVSLYWEGQTLATAYVEGGVADFTFPPLTNIGNLMVTATQFNHKPYQGVIEVTPSAGPFVISDFITIKDPTGDIDGKADFGEAITLDIQLSNVGVDVALATEVAISTSDLNVNLTDASEFIGDLAVNTPSLITDAFALTINDDVVDGHVVPLDVMIVFNDSMGYQFTYNMVLQAPDLIASNFQFSDYAGGNNNKRLDSGETATMTILNRNIGTSLAPDAKGTLWSDSPWLTISPTADLGDLDALTGSVAEVFTIEVSDQAPQVQQAMLYYTLESGNYKYDVTYGPMIINAIIEDFETHNFDSYPWSFEGNKPWVITTFQSYSGAYCTRSGSITHDQSSEMEMQLNVISDGSVSFARRVSSEVNYDFLRFYIDDVEMDAWSGDQFWEEFTFPVTAGIHTLKWSYEKDNLASSGSDRAWVDEIVLPPFQIVVDSDNPLPSTDMVQVFPNPTEGLSNLVLDLGSDNEFSAFLYDNTGRQLQTLQAQKRFPAGRVVLPIDLRNQASGMYFVRVNTGNESTVLKVVRN